MVPPGHVPVFYWHSLVPIFNITQPTNVQGANTAQQVAVNQPATANQAQGKDGFISRLTNSGQY